MISGLTGFHPASVLARPVSFAGYTTGVNSIQKLVIIGNALLTSAYRQPIGLMASPTAKPHVIRAATPSGNRRIDAVIGTLNQRRTAPSRTRRIRKLNK